MIKIALNLNTGYWKLDSLLLLSPMQAFLAEKQKCKGALRHIDYNCLELTNQNRTDHELSDSTTNRNIVRQLVLGSIPRPSTPKTET
jgi:hypothetical protein